METPSSPLRSDRPSRSPLQLAYVADRVVTLALTGGACVAAGAIDRQAGRSGLLLLLCAVGSIGALVLMRIASPAWLWLLVRGKERRQMRVQFQLDAAETVAVAIAAVALGVRLRLGLVVSAMVAAGWAAVWVAGRCRWKPAPFAAASIEIDPDALVDTDDAGVPAKNVVVDEWAQSPGRLVSHAGQPFILLSPHVARTYETRQIRVIIAHELGHWAHRDLGRTAFWRGVLIVLAALVAAASIRLFGFSLDEPHAVACGVLVLALTEVAGVGALAHILRGWERRATHWALETTGDVEAFVSTMERIHTDLGSPPKSGWWSCLLGEEQPSLSDALRQAEQFGTRR